MSGRRIGSRLRLRPTIAVQYLIMQLLIIAVVLSGAVVVSVTQATKNFETVESRRSLSAAESLAANPLLRMLLPQTEARMGSALPAMAESVRSVSGLTSVSIANAKGTILTSSYPNEIDQNAVVPGSEVAQGRAWRGTDDRAGSRVLVAQVPVLDESGNMIGIVTAGQRYPSTWDMIRDIAPSALFTLLLCLLLGTAGSVLLARRVKHQTRGLEPREIAELFEHREALLHGVKEGIVSIGPDLRITLCNDVAMELLGLPEDCVGRTLSELNVKPQVSRALLTEQETPDRQFLIGEKVIVFNRMPVSSSGRDLGSVTTLRDRTELTQLEQELGDSKATSDMLRAQTHEFANHLHTISGLVQLGEFDEVVGFIDGVSFSRTKFVEDVSTRIADPTISALLIAKASLAAERGVHLGLSATSALDRCTDTTARDLTTVIGNLIDNALDAVVGQDEPEIVVTLEQGSAGGAGEDSAAGIGAAQVRVVVADNGPGVDDAVIEEIFAQGFSTKDAQAASGGRGFGLALTRLVCERSGGSVSVTNGAADREGARFVATIGPGMDARAAAAAGATPTAHPIPAAHATPAAHTTPTGGRNG